jgi:hypothetical protein
MHGGHAYCIQRRKAADHRGLSYGDFPQLVRRRQHNTFRRLVLAQSRVSNPEKPADVRALMQTTPGHCRDSHSPAQRSTDSAHPVQTTSEIDTWHRPGGVSK